MPRIRTLKPEHRQHRKVGTLPDREYRLWVSMLLEADDDGRFRCEAVQLKVQTWPYHHTVRVEKVEAAIQRLAFLKLIVLYDTPSGRCAYFPSWRDHQRIHSRHYVPSKLPAPPDWTGTVLVPELSGIGTGEVPPDRDRDQDRDQDQEGRVREGRKPGPVDQSEPRSSDKARNCTTALEVVQAVERGDLTQDDGRRRLKELGAAGRTS